MRINKVDISKFHIFIYKPSGSYIVIEKSSNVIFEKLLIIYGDQFEKVSDNQVVNAYFLSYDEKTKDYDLKTANYQAVKVNDLLDLPAKAKLFLKLRNAFNL